MRAEVLADAIALIPAGRGAEADEVAAAVAGRIAAQPALVRRYTREVITLEIRRRLRDELSYGLALEGLAYGYGNWS